MDALAQLEPSPVLQIALVQPEFAPAIWDTIKPYIHKALVRSHALNKTNTDHVLANILLRRSDLWIAFEGKRIDAAVIGHVIQWPLSKTYYFPIIGARPFTLNSWLIPMRDAIERHAKAMGCSDLGGEFRKGWARAAGFEVAGVLLTRKLD